METIQDQKESAYNQAQAFRIILYREFINAKGCTPQDVWQTWLKMPYAGPNREGILKEMKEALLKSKENSLK